MAEATLAQKVAFLSRPEAYGPGVDAVACRETHMSWVFLAGARAYKLKKPVRFSYLDFSTQARREAACQAEIKLNRRLAPDVYLEVASLTTALPSTCSGSYAALSLGGPGPIVDWLVVMRRLDERQTLEHALQQHSVEQWQLDRLVAALVQFYRRAAPVPISPALHLSDWRESLAYNHRVLLEPRFAATGGPGH